jgi:tight adherence protein B
MSSIVKNISITLVLPAILAFFYFGIRYIKDDLAMEDSHYENLKKLFSKIKAIAKKVQSNRKIFIALVWIIVFISTVFFLRNVYFCLFISFFMVIIVWDYLSMLQKRKQEKLHSQLIEFLMNMIIMLRSGKTVRAVFIESTRFMKDPLKILLKRFVNEIQFKSSLEEALDDFMIKSGSEEVKLFVTALKINNKTGGDLIDVLNNIIETLKNSLELRSRLKTATLQSRFTGNVIAFFPIAAFFMLMLFTKNSMNDFFSSTFGNFMIIIGGALELLGVFFIKKIINDN